MNRPTNRYLHLSVALAAMSLALAIVACGSSSKSSGTNAASRAAQQPGMRAKALCIREHGVPNLPDPTFAPGGEGVTANLPPDWNPQAPAVEKASRACLHVGTLIPEPDSASGGSDARFIDAVQMLSTRRAGCARAIWS